jgi:hypothetical protein
MYVLSIIESFFSCFNFQFLISLKIMYETAVLFDMSITVTVNSNYFKVVIPLAHVYPFLYHFTLAL